MASLKTDVSPRLVTVSLEDLRKGNIPDEMLEDAFGPSSLGIMIVKDLPTEFKSLRERILSYASYLANLPQAQLDALASPASSYLTGWSHGKEALKPGVYDTQKGSFYVNCAFYQATDFSKIPHPLATSFPEQTTPNLWPDESVLPGYRETFEAICTLIIDTAVLVAKACDRYAEARINGYQRGYLERVVRDSVITKARLLHYFARTSIGQQADGKDDDWCATHVDHGCLTGLTSAMYIDEGAVPPVRHASGANESSLPPLPALPGPSDSTTGLYIHARDSSIVKVLIPADQLAFQTGEALQLITNGKFRAVPHFVKGDRGCGSDTKVTRNTLAVFTQPNLGDVVDAEKGLTFGQFTREVISRF